MRIFVNNDDVSLKEPVSLMARQEQLERVIRDADGVAFGDFVGVMVTLGVMKVMVIGVGHLEKGKEASEQLC